jgi:hypothetical protein
MMDFDELLAKILQLLQQEKRLSYRALKRRFALDDEYLEDIKAELIQAKQVARDEAGAVLVWTGGTSSAPTTASRTSSSKWTIFSGKVPVAQRQVLLTAKNTRRSLSCLSERISILIGQNAGGKALILQAFIPAVSDTLFDSSQAQRL